MLTELPVVNAYYAQQRATAQRAGRDAVTLWNDADRDTPLFDRWYLTLPLLTDVIAEAQYEAANRAAVYTPRVVREQGGVTRHAIRPVGYLSPTDFLDYGLTAAPVTALKYRQAGGREVVADTLLRTYLKRFATTMVEDTGREAVHGQMFVEPDIKLWYRKLELPSCNRCAILAGRPYSKEADFDRHPQCDCTSVPAVEYDDSIEYNIVDHIKNGDITGFNKDEIDAIVNHNADINQITNAKRGMSKANIYGKDIQVTSEGTTRRGLAGQRLSRKYGSDRVPESRYRVSRAPRLTPKEIYRQTAGDEDHRVRLMRLHGFLL